MRVSLRGRHRGSRRARVSSDASAGRRRATSSKNQIRRLPNRIVSGGPTTGSDEATCTVCCCTRGNVAYLSASGGAITAGGESTGALCSPLLASWTQCVVQGVAVSSGQVGSTATSCRSCVPCSCLTSLRVQARAAAAMPWTANSATNKAISQRLRLTFITNTVFVFAFGLRPS